MSTSTLFAAYVVALALGIALYVLGFVSGAEWINRIVKLQELELRRLRPKAEAWDGVCFDVRGRQKKKDGQVVPFAQPRGERVKRDEA
ncbi:MAG: hypothetical protein Q8M07_29540 [Prosthecobacter sp.]|nr:hypothetical protein [Prosthecobacter sp.]